LSLTQPRPTPDDLDPNKGLRDFRKRRMEETGRTEHVLTGPMPTAPNPFGEEWVKPTYKHAPKDRVEMALIRHAIWFGPPLIEDLRDGKDGPRKLFRDKVADAASRLRGLLASILWVDVPRTVVEYAEDPAHEDEEYFEGVDLVALRSQLKWAKESDVSLVPFREVFNRENPIPVWLLLAILVAYAQQQGPGWAG